MAGVGLGDIHLDFTWQLWHNLTSTVVLRGRHGTDAVVLRGTFAWQAWDLVTCTLYALGPGLVARDARDARDVAALCVAGVGLGDIHLDLTWQAWHNLTSTVVLRGRHGTHGTGWRPWARFSCARDARDAAALCMAGVGLGDIHLDFTWQAWHNHTNLTYNNFTHTQT